jgi:hypothetical protein
VFVSLHVPAMAFQGLKDGCVKNELMLPISFPSSIFLLHSSAFYFILPGPESARYPEFSRRKILGIADGAVGEL